MESVQKIQLLTPFFILAILVVLVEGFVIRYKSDLLNDADRAITDANSKIAALEKRAAIADSSARIDWSLTAATEEKKAESNAKLNQLKEASCHIDDDDQLDERLRELIRDAYRVAICTEASDPSMPAPTGTASP